MIVLVYKRILVGSAINATAGDWLKWCAVSRNHA